MGALVAIAVMTFVLSVASMVAAKPVFAAKVALVISTPCVVLVLLLYLAAWLELGPLSIG